MVVSIATIPPPVNLQISQTVFDAVLDREIVRLSVSLGLEWTASNTSVVIPLNGETGIDIEVITYNIALGSEPIEIFGEVSQFTVVRGFSVSAYTN